MRPNMTTSVRGCASLSFDPDPSSPPRPLGFKSLCGHGAMAWQVELMDAEGNLLALHSEDADELAALLYDAAKSIVAEKERRLRDEA